MEQNNNVNFKKQALTNVAIFVAVFLVLLLGVKLATWSAAKWSDVSNQETVNEETLGENSEDSSLNQASVAEALAPVTGTGEIVLLVSSQKDTILREIHFYNPYTSAWLLVYDGYKQVSKNPSEAYRVFLNSALKFTKVRARTIDNIKDFDKEVEIKGGSSVNVLLEL